MLVSMRSMLRFILSFIFFHHNLLCRKNRLEKMTAEKRPLVPPQSLDLFTQFAGHWPNYLKFCYILSRLWSFIATYEFRY